MTCSTASQGDEPLQLFESDRPRLLGLAYRMLGTFADAEDVVQDAWLRFQAVEPATIEKPTAWLTTVTTRLAVDRLRSARRRRERYVGPWLPEPLVTEDPGSDPERAAELSDSLTLGFLTLLDRLGPLERAVFLLFEVFAVPYAEIAPMVGRSEPTCRQIASRARHKLRQASPAPAPNPQARGAVGRLLAALAAGDINAVITCLAPEVVLVADGGPHARAARRPVIGADRVARWLVNVSARQPPGSTVRLTVVNTEPGIVARHDDTVFFAIVFTPVGTTIGAIWVVNNPDKLHHLDRSPSIQ